MSKPGPLVVVLGTGALGRAFGAPITPHREAIRPTVARFRTHPG